MSWSCFLNAGYIESLTTNQGEGDPRASNLMIVQTKGALSLQLAMPAQDTRDFGQLVYTMGLVLAGTQDINALPALSIRRKLDTVRMASYASIDSAAISAELNRLVSKLSPAVHSQYRISQVNAQYGICASYAHAVLVPAVISDTDLSEVSDFRSHGRFPRIAWISGQGAVLATSAQPRMGFARRRCPADDKLLGALRSSGAVVSAPLGRSITPVSSPSLHICDLRPLKALIGNVATGGGTEDCSQDPSMHSVSLPLMNYKELNACMIRLRTALNQQTDTMASAASFCTSVAQSGWLGGCEALLRASLRVASLIQQGSSVLVHCSNGWDRTPQVATLAMLLLDSHFRTLAGFQQLVNQEWLGCGHRFADRHGLPHVCAATGDGVSSTWESTLPRSKDCAPIFMQWLECVWNLQHMFPTAFEFTDNFLLEILYAAYSGQSFTFLCNSPLQRRLLLQTHFPFSFWSQVNQNSDHYTNHTFSPGPAAQAALLFPLAPWLVLPWMEAHVGPRWAAWRFASLVPAPLLCITQQQQRQIRYLVESALQREAQVVALKITRSSCLDVSVQYVRQQRGQIRAFIADLVDSIVDSALSTPARVSRSYSSGTQPLCELSASETCATTSVARSISSRGSSQLLAGGFWQPDRSTNVCSGCCTRFTFFRRKHHCRLCGLLFCSRCAYARPPSGMRACDHCHSVSCSMASPMCEPSSTHPAVRFSQAQCMASRMQHKSGKPQHRHFEAQL